ncbi:MAG: DUF3883 domain-containing protein [Pyrinomonadaceae bacterium]
MSQYEQNLSILQDSAYDEYQTLKKHDFTGKPVAFIPFLALHLVLSSLLGGVIRLLFHDWEGAAWVAGTYFVWIGWGFTIGVVETLNLAPRYYRVFSYFSHRGRKHRRFKELEAYFIPIEEENRRLKEEEGLRLQAKALNILTSLEAEIERRKNENRYIESEIKYKRKWREEFNSFESTILANRQFFSEAVKIIELNLEFLKYGIQRNSFSSLARRLKYDNDSWLLSRLRQIKGWSPPEHDYTVARELKPRESAEGDSRPEDHQRTTPNSFTSEDFDEIVDELFPADTKTEPAVEEVVDNGESIFLPYDEAETIGIDTEQLDLFNDENVSVENIRGIPKQRKKSRQFRAVRLSEEFYADVEGVRADVGRRGELMALEFEKHRVLREEGPEFLDKVVHVSVTEGDGLGYDIRSYKKGLEVFIEVKTTIRTFWSNLFFTRTEYETMLGKGEQYLLMRIWEFDVTTCLGEFRIFDGAEAINSTFKFDPNIYTLNQKSN